MPRPRLAALAACLLLLPLPAECDTSAAPPNSNIFDPLHAPEIVIKIGVRRIVLVPHHVDNGVGLSARTIESQNKTSFTSLVTANVPGAAAAPSGEFHVRGSHGQYTYYLDGAPLPESVSGSFSDLIDPKNIESLRIYTGGFPARYGDNLAAVFDVTAKAGRPGRPAGFAQQIAQGYGTFQTTVQAGGGGGTFGYFVSGVRSSTDRRLDPVTPQPLHDAGTDSVVFGKFDIKAGGQDRVILDTARTDALIQIPNEPNRQAIGRNDVQREDGDFANLIWRHDGSPDSLVVALYSHQSRLRYSGDPAHDLAGATPYNPLVSAFEDRIANYIGLRTDYVRQAGSRHKIGLGIDANTLTGAEKFTLINTVFGQDGTESQVPTVDNHAISGGDRAAYLQDDWTPGRWLVNYGVRYDIHKADTTTSQLSPRLNLTYTAGGHDKFHAYYDRLFQPAPIEDVRHLDPNAVAFKPERDNFYEVGWQHSVAGTTAGLSAYYKTEKDVIDENILAGTQIREPFNVQKGYVRGIEFSLDGALSRALSYYANYARSWARAAGDFSGGLIATGAPLSYFYDDHDQTHTASVGLAYDRQGITVNLDGEYGSGFPFGQRTDANGNPVSVNFLRVPPHFIFNLDVGTRIGSGQLAFTAGNLFNHPYVIKQASPFSDREFGQARTFGVKWTQYF